MPTLYRYFPSKAELIDAVAGQWLRRSRASLSDIADSPEPADDKLEALSRSPLPGNTANAPSATPMSSTSYVGAVDHSRAMPASTAPAAWHLLERRYRTRASPRKCSQPA